MKTLLISLFGLFLMSCGAQKQLVGAQGNTTETVSTDQNGPKTQKQATLKKPLPPNTASNKYSAKRQKKNGSLQ